MKIGKPWSSWRIAVGLGLALLGAGCAQDRAMLEHALAQPASPDAAALAQYRAGCPDILALTLAQRPELSGQYRIGVDGAIDLGEYRVAAQDRTFAELAQVIAAETGSTPDSVKIEPIELKSQHILLFGEINGSQRSVPYRGQETVVQLLQRAGGITHGAAPNDVYVVRPHLGDSQRPEVFRVDLHAILVKHDAKTNIRLLPFDQVYVGESRLSQIARAVPPWLRVLDPVQKK